MKRFLAILALTFLQNSISQTKLKPLPLPELQELASVYSLIKSDLYSNNPLSDQDLLIAAIKGMVKAADPDGGQFFDHKDFLTFQNSSLGKKQGAIGLDVTLENNLATVIEVLPNSPAEKNNIELGDSIYSIDNEIVGNKNFSLIPTLLKGEIGSLVTLQVKKANKGEFKLIQMKREELPVKMDRVSNLNANVVILKIEAFKENSVNNIIELLTKKYSENHFQTLLIDLRNHPGGALSTVSGLGSVFLPEGVEIGRTIGKTEFKWISNQQLYAPTAVGNPYAETFRNMPLYVLVNQNTSAGAEMLTFALKENNRAIVLGEKTSGRGSIQTVKQLGPDTAVKLTTSLWFSPNGNSFNGVGIEPNIKISNKSYNEQIKVVEKIIEEMK